MFSAVVIVPCHPMSVDIPCHRSPCQWLSLVTECQWRPLSLPVTPAQSMSPRQYVTEVPLVSFSDRLGPGILFLSVIHLRLSASSLSLWYVSIYLVQFFSHSVLASVYLSDICICPHPTLHTSHSFGRINHQCTALKYYNVLVWESCLCLTLSVNRSDAYSDCLSACPMSMSNVLSKDIYVPYPCSSI